LRVKNDWSIEGRSFYIGGNSISHQKRKPPPTKNTKKNKKNTVFWWVDAISQGTIQIRNRRSERGDI